MYVTENNPALFPDVGEQPAIYAISAAREGPEAARPGCLVMALSEPRRHALAASIAAAGWNVSQCRDPDRAHEKLLRQPREMAVIDLDIGNNRAPPGDESGRAPPDTDVGRAPPGVEIGRAPPGIEIGRSPPGVEIGRAPPGIEIGRAPPDESGRAPRGIEVGRAPPGDELGRAPPGDEVGRAPPGADALKHAAVRLSRHKDLLLVVCGNAEDAAEEIWARQLGAWLYLPGVDPNCGLTGLLEEACDIATWRKASAHDKAHRRRHMATA